MALGKVKAIPGACDFIELCKAKGLSLAVATSAARYKMNINLKFLNLQNGVLDALICGEDIANNKPNPEIFQKAAEKLGLQPEECLVVEDAPSGVKAAKSARCKCLALLTTFKTDELVGADWIVKNLSNVPVKVFGQ